VAANARLGRAIADFFPSVTLVGQVGRQSVSFDDLALGSARVWSVGPSVRIPIFEGGLLAARKFEEEARKDQASAAFVQSVLQAFGEVADAIAGIVARSESRDRLREAEETERRAVELVTIQYEEGLKDYLNVLDAQRGLLDARLDLLQEERLLLSEF